MQSVSSAYIRKPFKHNERHLFVAFSTLAVVGSIDGLRKSSTQHAKTAVTRVIAGNCVPGATGTCGKEVEGEKSRWHLRRLEKIHNNRRR